MSMGVLTIVQFLRVLLVYLCMTFFLPAALFSSRIKNQRFSVRFMIYQVTGNFYMMNLVFILQLLRISNRFTLTVFTVLPFCAGYVIINKKRPKEAAGELLLTAERLAGGQLGARLLLRRVRIAAGRQLKLFVSWLFQRIRGNFFDLLLFAGVTAALAYAYGANLLLNYGYCASDILVHHYWINYLVKNEIFVAGIYPYGFHCMIYYLRTVFGIPTYVLLRVFCFVQTLMIHYMLIAFLKNCCKSKYAPYIGLFVYTLAEIFSLNTYVRYYSSLPQEFGMLFILPSVSFLYAFFEKKEKGEKENKWYLACFAMSFSMTISVHFYNAMICGLFCLGIAVGYGFRLFRRKVFGKVMLAGILSVVIAVLPMGIAFAMGTPLQGSLGWGLNIIMGTDEEDDEEQETEEAAEQAENAAETEGSTAESTAGGTAGSTAGGGETEAAEQTESIAETEGSTAGSTAETEGGTAGGGETGATEQTESIAETEGSAAESTAGDTAGGKETEQTESIAKTAEAGESLVGKLAGVVKKLPAAIWESVCVYLIPAELPVFRLAVPGAIGLLALLSVIFFLLRQKDYAARLLSAAVYMILLSVLFGASGAGLPALMDELRTSIFYAYSIVMIWSLCADTVLSLFFGWWKKRRMMNLVSFLLVGAVLCYTAAEGLLRDAADYDALQMNEAVICLTNILHDNEDFTWTICSANDELRMGEDYGYHYELNDFLKEMEYSGNYGSIIIPTEKVYFFIEKVPVDYSASYENSGQSVSEEGASRPLPAGSGISVYQGENRWIEMSRMYYWARAFQSMYPNEMKVYYETDNFICYYVQQDLYSPFNFAIDYGYNGKSAYG